MTSLFVIPKHGRPDHDRDQLLADVDADRRVHPVRRDGDRHRRDSELAGRQRDVLFKRLGGPFTSGGTCTLVSNGDGSSSSCSLSYSPVAAGSPTVTASYPGGGSLPGWAASSGRRAGFSDDARDSDRRGLLAVVAFGLPLDDLHRHGLRQRQRHALASQPDR